MNRHFKVKEFTPEEIKQNAHEFVEKANSKEVKIKQHLSICFNPLIDKEHINWTKRKV